MAIGGGSSFFLSRGQTLHHCSSTTYDEDLYVAISLLPKLQL